MTDASAAARAACAGSDASAATPCAPSGACPPRLTARTRWPARTSSTTTAPPMAPVAPKTTCNEPPGSAIVLLLPLALIVSAGEPGHRHAAADRRVVAVAGRDRDVCAEAAGLCL